MEVLSCGRITKRKLEGNIKNLTQEKETLISEREAMKYELQRANKKLKDNNEERSKMKEVIEKEVIFLHRVMNEIHNICGEPASLMIKDLKSKLEGLHHQNLEAISKAQEEIMNQFNSQKKLIHSLN